MSDIVKQLRDHAKWLETRSFASLSGDLDREAAGEIERLTRERDAARLDRDEQCKVRDSWVEEAERLAKENHRQRVKLANRAAFIVELWQGMQAARRWIPGEFRDGPLGDPASKSWACLWCGEMLQGREHAKEHCRVCPESPLVQRIKELKAEIESHTRYCPAHENPTVKLFQEMTHRFQNPQDT